MPLDRDSAQLGARPALATGPVRDRRPLSVQVYDRLIAALGASNVTPGDAIPPEIELAAELGVSRTVLREALRLLEEDGILQRGADRRRRLLAEPPGKAPGFHAPLEDLLQVSGDLQVEVVRADVIPATMWGARLLAADLGTPLLCWESVLRVDGTAIGSALELVTHADPSASSVSGTGDHERRSTLLQALGPQFRSRLAMQLWRLAPGATTGTRTGLAGLPRDAELSSLTTVLTRHGRPVYLATHVLRLDMVTLAVGGDAAGVDDSEETTRSSG